MVLAHLNALKNKNHHEQFTSNFTIFSSNTSRWLLLEGRNEKKEKKWRETTFILTLSEQRC